ncbi:hypothetical protein [Oscillatoria sp. HE19RPO]|nr:hypothetical protein [Oscillatoria sp. HE19RPO]
MRSHLERTQIKSPCSSTLASLETVWIRVIFLGYTRAAIARGRFD